MLHPLGEADCGKLARRSFVRVRNASKLERNSAVELMINQVYILGALSIGRQENPRRLELVLNTILPANQRVRYFD